MLLSVQEVRQSLALTTSYVAGDGKGGENPVNCAGANFVRVHGVATRSDGVC
jgi:hypothetical protein